MKRIIVMLCLLFLFAHSSVIHADIDRDSYYVNNKNFNEKNLQLAFMVLAQFSSIKPLNKKTTFSKNCSTDYINTLDCLVSNIDNIIKHHYSNGLQFIGGRIELVEKGVDNTDVNVRFGYLSNMAEFRDEQQYILTYEGDKYVYYRWHLGNIGLSSDKEDIRFTGETMLGIDWCDLCNGDRGRNNERGIFRALFKQLGKNKYELIYAEQIKFHLHSPIMGWLTTKR